jgi:excisionase family DNA binding protein
MRAAHPIVPEFMTVFEVADYLHCHPTTVYRLVHTGGLPFLRLGSDYRFRRSDLEQYLANSMALCNHGL